MGAVVILLVALRYYGVRVVKLPAGQHVNVGDAVRGEWTVLTADIEFYYYPVVAWMHC